MLSAECEESTTLPIPSPRIHHHADSPAAQSIRSVVAIAFGGSCAKCAAALHVDRTQLWRCMIGREPTSPRILSRLRAFERRLKTMQAQLQREMADQCARLALIPHALRSLPDPDERPYERELGPRGEIRKRTDKRTRKARAEAKQKKPPRKGRLELEDLLLDGD